MRMQSLSFLLFVSCFVYQAVSLTQHDIRFHREAWQVYKKEHNKLYDDNGQDELRFRIFHKNSIKMIQHNLDYDAGKSTYKMGYNKFFDWTEEELESLTSALPTRKESGRSTYLPHQTTENLPTNVDWRKKGAVTEVKDQGHCGSCWAFSSTGAIEGQVFRKSKRLYSLSEQQLVDCSSPFGNHGCQGGLMDYAYEYLISTGGIESEKLYPYTSGITGNQSDECYFSKVKVVSKLKDYVELEYKNETQLLLAVTYIGPISVAIVVNKPFKLYEQGIFEDPGCDTGYLNHGVLLVGYGIDNGVPYWLVKNSFGEDWGENGYVRISRKTKNYCRITEMASFPLV